VPDPDWIHISAFGIYFILLLTKSVFLSAEIKIFEILKIMIYTRYLGLKYKNGFME